MRDARRVLGVFGAAALTAGFVAGCSGNGPNAGGTSSTSASSSATASPEPSASSTPEASGTPSGSPEAGPSPSTEPSASPTPTPTPSPTETTPPEAAPAPTPEAPAQLASGAQGDQVAALQQRLSDLGYFVTDVDGDFGHNTQQAVWALQKAAGLYRDGVVGPQTQGALDQGVRPQARTAQGKAIEIDIDRQLLLAVENGQVVRVINASSGNGETFEAKGHIYRAYTPTGTFAVGRQIDGMHSSTLELGDMWRPKFFAGGIAVHGSASIPPYPASHGCVRVSSAAMNWIWDVWGAPRDTTVVVY
ncbi:L,D-transpeptidase family protein [Antribacter sp. KLBMP9083]|uniref:L,D-transpeptidase family protein n=1 Tax=Antribacter soli TaxID=2910976 RepID=A0AA41QG19_9MICO|nr:L,D-transpeptidase family protein [Antribacter soli]MCF4122794.1 L,D-transpeptidase family protein [Antribacter soli]